MSGSDRITVTTNPTNTILTTHRHSTLTLPLCRGPIGSG